METFILFTLITLALFLISNLLLKNKKSFKLPFVVLGFVISLLATHSSNAQYKIAENLYLKIDGSPYPKGFNPTWNLVNTGGEPFLTNEDITVKKESFKNGAFVRDAYGTTCKLTIGSYEGKPVIFYRALYTEVHAFEIMLPGKPTYINETPQTFELKTIGSVYKYPNADNEKNYFLESFKGNITLSSNSKGDITLGLTFEEQTKGNLMRLTKQNYLIPLLTTATQAKNYSESAKYAPILEHFLQIYYQGWKYDKIYIPNSLKNITVLSKDIKGNPTKIRGICSFELYGPTEGWIEVLLNEGTVYGVTFYDFPNYILTPDQNVDKRMFTQAELAKMDYLQNIYLYNKILEIQKKYDSNTNIIGCLKKEKEDILQSITSEHVSYHTDNDGIVRPHYTEIEIGKRKIGERDVLKNTCKNSFTIKGIKKYRDTYALIYEDTSYEISAGETTEKQLFQSSDIITAPVNSTIYFIGNSANYTPKSGTQLQNDIAKTKNNNTFTPSEPSNNKVNTSSNIKSIIAKRLDDNSIEINSNTNTSDITVKKGAKVNIVATGSIKLGDFAGFASPNGISGYDGYNKVQGFKHGSLLGKMGNGSWFFIGENRSFLADRDGILNFMVNDDDPSNNFGSFIVEYGINKEVISTQKVTSTPQSTTQNTTTNNPQLTNTKPTFKPITILEDNFADNKNRWDVSSKNHIISIEGNRMIYTNNEKKDRVYAMVGVPISIKNNDDYTIEASMQSLTPCANDKLGPLNSILLRPNQSFYGFAIGDQKTDILFSVGNNVNERKVRDDYVYTCIPSYFITSTVAGSTNYIQEWTKSNLVAEGGNVNILKLEKKGSQFNFYVNNRLISSKNSYSLSNDNAIKIVSSSFTKISVNNMKVILTNSEDTNSSNNSIQSNQSIKSNTAISSSPVKNEKSIDNTPNAAPNYERTKPMVIKTYKGTITNTTYNLKGKCEMTFGKNPDGSFQLYGETDNKKIVGKWDLKGRLVESNMYIFNGDILFGYPGTDFPLGTSAPFKITVTINEKSMNGNYTIQSDNKAIGTQEGVFTLR